MCLALFGYKEPSLGLCAVRGVSVVSDCQVVQGGASRAPRPTGFHVTHVEEGKTCEVVAECMECRLYVLFLQGTTATVERLPALV